MIHPSWSAALRSFDEGMRRQNLAEKTRRAYGVDLGQLAEWASAQGLAPEQSELLNARLILLLANQVGDAKVLKECVEAAKTLP